MTSYGCGVNPWAPALAEGTFVTRQETFPAYYRAPPSVLHFDDPAMHASIYPETITLAALMLSPYWVAAAVSSRRRDREHFFAEAARRLRQPSRRSR